MRKIRKKDWIEIVLHIAFWTVIFFTLLSFTRPNISLRVDQEGSILQEDIRHPLSPQLFVTLGLMIVLFYSNVLWVFKTTFRRTNRLLRLVLPLAWFGLVCGVSAYTDTFLPRSKRSDMVLQVARDPGKKPLVAPERQKEIPDPPIPDDKIKQALERGQSGAFIFTGEGFSAGSFVIFGVTFGLSIAWFFLKEWSRVEKMRAELAAVQLDTEVKFLKSQVNPHFLFNTLNNLFSMAQKTGDDDLADGISKLSGMMRYMIYESNEEKVPLEKEIAYLEDCIQLNKLRYADREAVVKFDHPAGKSEVTVAPMLFIPFVENAFKHGIRIGQSSEIHISIAVANRRLVFSCANTVYSVKKMDPETGGIGLGNVKRRLELVYPGNYTMTAHRDGDKYLVNLELVLA